MIGRALLALAALCALSGCQLSPIYAGGGSGAVAAALRNVDVAPIENRSGWLVRQALIDRLGTPEGTARYRIEVELDDQIEGFGLRLDDAMTGESRTLRARSRLVSAANGQGLLQAAAARSAGIHVTPTTYAPLHPRTTAIEPT